MKAQEYRLGPIKGLDFIIIVFIIFVLLLFVIHLFKEVTKLFPTNTFVFLVSRPWLP